MKCDIYLVYTWLTRNESIKSREVVLQDLSVDGICFVCEVGSAHVLVSIFSSAFGASIETIRVLCTPRIAVSSKHHGVHHGSSGRTGLRVRGVRGLRPGPRSEFISLSLYHLLHSSRSVIHIYEWRLYSNSVKVSEWWIQNIIPIL